MLEKASDTEKENAVRDVREYETEGRADGLKEDPEAILAKLGYKIEWDKKVENIEVVRPVQILLHDPTADSNLKSSNPSLIPSVGVNKEGEKMLEQGMIVRMNIEPVNGFSEGVLLASNY